MGEMVNVGIRMPKELKDDLERLAQQERRKCADYCRIILEDHVKAKKIKGE